MRKSKPEKRSIATYADLVAYYQDTRTLSWREMKAKWERGDLANAVRLVVEEMERRS